MSDGRRSSAVRLGLRSPVIDLMGALQASIDGANATAEARKREAKSA